MKHRDDINKLRREGRIYETTEMSELMNESFWSVFTKETDFVAPKVASQNQGIQEIGTSKETRNQETVGRAGC